MRKISLNSNFIRIIAIVAIIVDHVGFYFQESLPLQVYFAFRCFGRIAMPIFAYLIVQGFFYTKDLSKYVKRVFLTGVITQIVIFTLYTINKFVFVEYYVSEKILDVNIIISFAISLIVLKALDEIIKLKIEKKKITKSIIALMFLCIIMIITYTFVPFDYSYQLLIYIVMLYFIEKIYKEKKMSKGMYCIMHIAAMIIFLILFNNILEYFAVFSLPFILLYNGERGKKSKFIQVLFYIMYPVQHFLLYLLAMVVK